MPEHNARFCGPSCGAWRRTSSISGERGHWSGRCRSRKKARVVGNDWTVQWLRNRWFPVDGVESAALSLAKQRIVVCEQLDGRIRLRHGDRERSWSGWSWRRSVLVGDRIEDRTGGRPSERRVAGRKPCQAGERSSMAARAVSRARRVCLASLRLATLACAARGTPAAVLKGDISNGAEKGTFLMVGDTLKTALAASPLISYPAVHSKLPFRTTDVVWLLHQTSRKSLEFRVFSILRPAERVARRLFEG